MSAVYNWTSPSEADDAVVALDACCPKCEERLALHQPDPELDDRLLGTCGECKTWYLLDGRGEFTHRLPSPNELI